MIAALILAVIGVAGYVALPRPTSRVDGTPLRFVNPAQVTTAIGVEDYPAWSPDGRMIAFAADLSGQPDGPTWDIWVVQPGGGAPINRTADHTGRDLFPSWSPNGSQVAFWSDRDGGGCYVMAALAGAPRRVAAASVYDPNPPQWSADGAELGCVNGDQNTVAIDVVSFQTGQLDGLELMFLSLRDGSLGAWAMPAAGGSGRWIATSLGAWRWSPVDRRIAVGEKGRLWVAGDDGRGRRVQLSDHAADARLSWTPDGMQVIFSGDSNQPGIYAVRADGSGGARKLLDITGRRGALGVYGTPSDGKYVYFTWDEDLGDIWFMNVEPRD